MVIELKPVTDEDAEFLYELLKEREGRVNISHKKLPTWKEHIEFIQSHPYSAWDIILHEDKKVGNIYLTTRDEIGIFIKSDCQSKGYGTEALQKFMKKFGKKRYLANINPSNFRSIQFFGKNGFTHIQNTYHIKFD